MTVVIDGTNGVSGVDGTASNPSYEGTDANTGIFFPAADTIAFSEGGTEVARFDSSGNFGIGTGSPSYKLDVVNSAANAIFGLRVKTTGTNGEALIDLDSTASNASAYLRFLANGTERARLTSGGTNELIFSRGSGPTESMRIDGSGNLLVGSTSSPATARTYLKGVSATSSDFALLVQNSASTDMNYVRNDGLFSTGVASQSPYNKTTASAANVFVDSGGVLNRSTSSIKYKQNVKDAVHGLSDLLNLRAVTYEGKSEEDAGKTFGGLLAEEVHNAGLTEFVQYADDGSPDALAYGNMVSLCIKAIQELKAELDATKAEVALLKGAA